MNHVSKAEVIEIIKYKDNINEYILKLEKARRYSPGTFVQLTLDIVTASDIWPDSRTFSIASHQKDIMKFIIKNVGAYTNRIFNELKVGSICTVKYPFGELFDKKSIDDKHVFIAGGVGITPFIGLVEYFDKLDKLGNIYLFYSAKHKDDLLHINDLKTKLKERLQIFITQEESLEYNNRRMNADDFQKVISDDCDVNFYICGSTEFNNDIKSIITNQGYEKIHMDEWE